jgi:hypothetical protein
MLCNPAVLVEDAMLVESAKKNPVKNKESQLENERKAVMHPSTMLNVKRTNGYDHEGQKKK